MTKTTKSKDYLIIGGGHQGLTMAAHFSLNGERVNLWNRTLKNIEEVYSTHKILSSGVVKGTAVLNKVSANIDEVWSDNIMVTTPATAHKDIARLIAHKVTDKTTIILNPGRTFGAIAFKEELIKQGNKFHPKIAETQTIVYTCRRDLTNKVSVFALKKDVLIASLDNQNLNSIIKKLPDCIRGYFKKAKSFFFTSLGNVGMILHCAPVLMNIGWIENLNTNFEYYYDGISNSVARFLEKLDNERLAVGKALGVDLESTREWLMRSYSIEGENLYECIRNNNHYKGIYAPKTLSHRYLEEDIPFGLVPLEFIAKKLRLETPVTSLIIDLANNVMDKDYRKIGENNRVNREQISSNL